jgi:hypothetical protein
VHNRRGKLNELFHVCTAVQEISQGMAGADGAAHSGNGGGAALAPPGGDSSALEAASALLDNVVSGAERPAPRTLDAARMSSRNERVAAHDNRKESYDDDDELSYLGLPPVRAAHRSEMDRVESGGSGRRSGVAKTSLDASALVPPAASQAAETTVLQHQQLQHGSRGDSGSGREPQAAPPEREAESKGRYGAGVGGAVSERRESGGRESSMGAAQWARPQGLAQVSTGGKGGEDAALRDAPSSKGQQSPPSQSTVTYDNPAWSDSGERGSPSAQGGKWLRRARASTAKAADPQKPRSSRASGAGAQYTPPEPSPARAEPAATDTSPPPPIRDTTPSPSVALPAGREGRGRASLHTLRVSPPATEAFDSQPVGGASTLAPRPAPLGGCAASSATAPAATVSGTSSVRGSLHVLPSAAPMSPTSSVGHSSIFSAMPDVYYSRSIHALPPRANATPPRSSGGTFRDNPELAARVAADQRAGRAGGYGGNCSPTASVASKASSATRRRARASLHALPKTAEEAREP